MSRMLRSLRFVRRLSSVGRLGAPAAYRALPTTAAARPGSVCCLASLQTDRNYVTKPAYVRPSEAPVNIDEALRNIDYKSRSYGYVFLTDLNNVLQAIAVTGNMTTTQALLLIRCCGFFLYRESSEIREKFAKKVWDMTKTLDVPMDVSHYNALLLVYLDNDTNFSPLEILIEMKEKNIAPNRVTFQRLIEQFCKKGDIAGATKILEHMSEYDIPLNEAIFNSLILGHSMADDIPNALQILDIMKQSGIEPSSHTYAALLCVHAKKGDINAMRSIFEECNNKDIIFTDKDILDVVYTLAINEHQDFVDEVLSHLDKGSTYNKNAMPVISKLLEKGKEHVAYKLQKSLIKVTNTDTKALDGYLFLKKLILRKCNAEQVIKYCNLMLNDDINLSAYETALYVVYQHNQHHLAITLMKAMKTSGREIREHYFYPLFVHYSKTNNLQGILNTMRSMIFDFEIVPMVLTVKDYIIPYMIEDPINNIKILLNNNLPFPIATNAQFIHLLDEKKINQAVKFMKNTQMVCRINVLEKPLTNAFLRTKDVNSLVSILHYQLWIKNKILEDQNIDETVEDASNNTKFINTVMQSIVTQLSAYDVEIISSILHNLLEKGLNIDKTTADHIKRHLGGNCNSEIESILMKLTSEDLKIISLEKELNVRDQVPNRFKQKMLNDLEEKAEKSVEFKMLLIQEQAKLLNETKVEKLVKELEEINPTYTPGLCATLVDYYAKIDNIVEAEKWYKRLSEINPDFKLNKAKLLNYAILLFKNNRPSEALEVLERPVLDPEVSREKGCEKLLNKVIQYCPDYLEAFYNKLQEYKYFDKVTPQLLSPFIKVYINGGDIDKAVEKFKWACETYKVTPHKNTLMMNIINKEDAKTLQHLTDFTIKIHGESNALFDLALCFLACERPRQARKILETPGLHVRQERILYTAKHFISVRDAQTLKKFIDLVSGLQYDVIPLYNMLLEAYEQENDWQKSLALWTQMQEDNIQPSAKFMTMLESILKNNNQQVPFGVTQVSNNVEIFIDDFQKALDNGNTAEARKVLEKVPKNARSSSLLQLIDYYTRENNLEAALENLNEFWQTKPKIEPQIEDIVVNIFTKLMDANDFPNITKVLIESSNFYRKQKGIAHPFTAILNKMYCKSNKYEDLLTYIDNTLENTNEEAKNIVVPLFHSITAIQAMLENPELEEKVKDVGFKALKYNLWSPINAVWAYKFLNNSPDAESFFNKHLKKFLSIPLILACKERGAWDKFPQIADKIVEFSGLYYDVKRKAARFLLTTLLNSDAPNKYELAFESLSKLVKAVPLNSISQEVLQKIEENVNDKAAFEALKTERERSQELAHG